MKTFKEWCRFNELVDNVSDSEPTQWMVVTKTAFGWENTWTDEDGNPQTFESEKQAQAALDEFFDDINDSVEMGHLEDDYNRNDYKIVRAD